MWSKTFPQPESVLVLNLLYRTLYLLELFWMGEMGHLYKCTSQSVLDKMGAAAEWTEPRSTLGSRLRAALSRSPGAPLPELAASEYNQMSPTPARGPRCALSVSWCSLDHRLRRPKKGVSLHTCTLGRKRDELRSKGINDRNVNIQKMQ